MKLQKSRQGEYDRYHISIPTAIVNSMQWEKGADLKWSLEPYKSKIRLVLDEKRN